MGDTSSFVLIVDKADARKSFNSLLDISRESGEVKRRPRKPYAVVLRSMAYALFQPADAHFGAKIELKSNGTLSDRRQLMEFFDYCFDACTRIDPLYALADGGVSVYDSGPAWCSVEHYRNPYFFCLEPEKKEYGYDPADNFIQDKAMLDKISEVRKVLSIDELVTLLRKHCSKVGIGPDGGVTVLKGYGETKPAVALRYFISQELLKRGVNITEGSAAMYAKELGIK